MNRKITIECIADIGDTVSVKNYRRLGKYENAEVIDITIKLNRKDHVNPYHVSYTVCLIRKSIKGNSLFLTVGSRNVHYLHSARSQ